MPRRWRTIRAGCPRSPFRRALGIPSGWAFSSGGMRGWGKSSAQSARCMAGRWRSRSSRRISSTRTGSGCVAEYTLQAEPPLAGTEMEIAGVRLWAPGDLAMVSLALPLGGEAAAEQAVRAAYGVALPGIGRSVVAGDGTRLIRLAPDLAF